MGELIGLITIVLIFGTPIVAILTHHMRKMAEMKGASNYANPQINAELAEIKKQVESLRDTTTRYDMSFDTALQRLESRMSHMEERQKAQEHEQSVIANRS